MAIAPRFPLLLFDAVEKHWIRCFEPRSDECALSILDAVAVLDSRFFRLCLLRMFQVQCCVPNTMNWTTVMIMVVHESPWILVIDDNVLTNSITPDDALTLLGVDPSWLFVGALPDVPFSVRFEWSAILGASCDPFTFVQMSICLSGTISHDPPSRLQDHWFSQARCSNPTTPAARLGEVERQVSRFP